MLLAAAALRAQTAGGPGLDRLANGVRLRLADGGTVQVEVCAERVFHVTAQPAGAPPLKPSLVVDKHWDALPFKLETTEADAIVLSTAKLRARIDRGTGAVSFLDAGGRPILAEQGRKFTPATVNKEQTWTVQQTYGCAPDEALYGLGQFQDGYWDWRGKPLQMQQQNSEIAAPMLLSNEGYGVLWDNASATDFNPVDAEIPLADAPAPTPSPAPGPSPAASPAHAARKREDRRAVRTGAFTTGEAGKYVFLATNGNHSTEIGIFVDDKPLIDLVNFWLPGSVSGILELPAHATVKVAVHGGGGNARLFAAPWDPGHSTFRSAVGDGVDYWFFYGPDLEDVIAGYREATGAAPLFPEWAYGFWQCRERYSSQKQILDTIAEFRRRQIPVDMVVQDWRYWGSHGWGAAAWEEKDYPDPKAMLDELHRMNCKFMLSVWPNPAGELHDALQKSGGLIAGTLYDPTNPAARALRWQDPSKGVFRPRRRCLVAGLRRAHGRLGQEYARLPPSPRLGRPLPERLPAVS